MMVFLWSGVYFVVGIVAVLWRGAHLVVQLMVLLWGSSNCTIRMMVLFSHGKAISRMQFWLAIELRKLWVLVD